MLSSKPVGAGVALLLMTVLPAFPQDCITDLSGVTDGLPGDFRGPYTDGSVISLFRDDPVDGPPGTGLAALATTRYVLSGYRYDDQPSPQLPDGTGKERILRFCDQVRAGDSEGSFVISIPYDAPSGFYSLGIVEGSQCLPHENSIVEAPAPAPPVCETFDFMVLPSYVVTTAEQLEVFGNSEDSDDSPAEMHFQFAGVSGDPTTPTLPATSLVSLSGGYPGGALGSGYVTYADNVVVDLGLPVFSGRETRMYLGDCEEESRSYPAATAQSVFMRCQQSAPGFNNNYQIVLSGVEIDDNGPAVYGILAGAGAAALACYVEPGSCLSAGTLTLGTQVKNAVDKALDDDDDRLGSVPLSFNLLPAGNQWAGHGGDQGIRMGFEGGSGGSIVANFQNYLVAGPRILDYRVTIDSIQILEGYEVGPICTPANEIFVDARAILMTDGVLWEPTTRFPSADGVWSVVEGTGIQLDAPFEIGGERYPQTPPEAPAIYVEIGVWEDDGDDQSDLIGLYSHTFFTEDLFRAANDTETMGGGRYIRRFNQTYFRTVEGFPGSDGGCGANLAPGYGYSSDGRQGRAQIAFTITATWLKELAQ